MIDPYFTFGTSFIAALMRILNYLRLHFAILRP